MGLVILSSIEEVYVSRRRGSLRIQNNLGMLLLAVWLIISGLTPFVPSLRGLGEIIPLLALGAGALILTGR